MKCKVCGKPLNVAQWSNDEQYKSCPKCSTEKGIEHVYYKYPDNFGNTEKRASTNHPDGPQSYCVPHRGRGSSTETRTLCSEL